MFYLKKIIVVIFAGFSIIVASFAMAETVDVRILVDVSGSMRANDPDNLRKSAVRLVSELMPQEATAGIWTFGEKVEQIIAPSRVDKQWKADASRATKRVHSRGQFTNIEAALDVATDDWGGTTQDSSERHVILLTDGMVDVSKKSADNEASRERILSSVLTRIHSAGAKIHTISLSENSDQVLMSALASKTEGWTEQINGAAALQRVFLHMFEQAARPDSVPLLDNRFDVDSSIREMTLLVFRESAEKALQLVSPSGKKLQQAFHPENVKWLMEDGYDLVTVSNPEQGTWQINTSPDPDNRVLIVTDLKLEMDRLPTSLLQGESVMFNAYITEQGQRMHREDFLNLLQAELVFSAPDGSTPEVYPLQLDSRKKQFSKELLIDRPQGEYEFVVRVDGGTFKREYRQKIRIHDTPIVLSYKLDSSMTAAQVLIRAEPTLTDLESLAGLLIITNPDGANEVLNLPSFSTEEVSLLVEMPINGIYQIESRIFGKGASGRSLNINTPPVTIEITAGSNSVESGIEPIDWLQVGLVILGGNIAIGLLLAGIWFWRGRRSAVELNKVVVK